MKSSEIWNFKLKTVTSTGKWTEKVNLFIKLRKSIIQDTAYLVTTAPMCLQWQEMETPDEDIIKRKNRRFRLKSMYNQGKVVYRL